MASKVNGVILNYLGQWIKCIFHMRDSSFSAEKTLNNEEPILVWTEILCAFCINASVI